jgi:hypothetical protein
MKKFTLALFLCLISWGYSSIAQQKNIPSNLKGNGQVFFYEDFNWGDPTDIKGWKLPEGYKLIDPDDIGYNFKWMPYDSIKAQYVMEPPFESTSGKNGYLGLPLGVYNEFKDPATVVNNSIEFPHFNCTGKSSVVVRYETHFMNGGPGLQEMKVSVDNGAHWAVYNVGFGVQHKDRPNDAAPGKPVIYEANISDVAAGMPDVIIQLHYGNTQWYFWVLDDFQLAEAWNNDLKIRHFTAEWDEGDEENLMTPFHMIPKSQLLATAGLYNWESSVINFGEIEQEDVYLDLSITKNNQQIWHKTTTPIFSLATNDIDTMKIGDKFTPVDYGHYQVTYDFKTSLSEETPADNKNSFFFHVNDSIYSTSDDSPDLAWSYLFERYGAADKVSCEDYFTGTILPIYADCEVSSLSTYIMGGLADGKIEFQFQLWKVPQEGDDRTPVKMLVTDMVTLDSAHFNTWITMAFSKDGETEFLKAGDLVYAGISQWDYHENNLVRRAKGLRIGTDRSLKMVGPTTIGIYDGNLEEGLGAFSGRRNLMCRLNLNDHNNRIDGVNPVGLATTLGQNYPNPFAGTTRIDYSLSNDADVIFEIRDITGRTVQTLNEGLKPAGSHQLDLNVSTLESGIYFYTLKAGPVVETRQMVVRF